jgi:cell division protein FtsB
MERGSERFDTLEQCLEERATVIQLSKLSGKLDALVSRVEDLEDENTELKKQVCRCGESKVPPVAEENRSDSGLSYATPEEESIQLPVPISVLPAVSGQRCKPSRRHLISRLAFPSLSPGSGVARSTTKIRKARVGFTQVVSGLESTRK